MTNRILPIIFLFIMDPFEQFRRQVDDYLGATQTDPTTFGRRALGDPNFVFQLREGRSPRSATIHKVIDFMEANPPAVSQPDAAA